MRTTKLFLLIVLSFGVSLISGGPCKISKNIMDCRQKGLTDCPSVVKLVTVLILDENNLTDLETMNCQNWTNLKSLSVRKNKLKNSLKFESFKVLESLDLSENKLSNLSLFGDQLSTVNVSSNFLSKLEIHLPNLLQLFSSNNQLNKLNFGQLIMNLHSSPLLKILDVSRNQINSLTVELMTFSLPNRLTINLSGNQLAIVNFNNFDDNKFGFNIDFSFNRITDFEINTKLHFGFLNFSNNQLSKIDGDKLNLFVNLNGIDFSQNPLSCFCNESESFINWMIKNKAIVLNPQSTMCKYPSKVQVFEVLCYSSTSPVSTSTSRKSSTSRSSVSTKLTTHPTSKISTKKVTTTNKPTSKIVTVSTKHSGTTKSSNTKTKSWKIALAVILPLLGLAIIFICYWVFCRHRNNYRRLDERNPS